MSLFTNMKSFTIDTRIISDVQRQRNQHYAHNYTAMVHHVEKKQCLNSLINLLKVPEILRKQDPEIFFVGLNVGPERILLP
jgi:hypothetical protein